MVAPMLNNTYFFILLSFIIFLYVGYRKIWPDISKILREDIAKIKKQFNIVETKKLDLQNELELVVSNHAIFKDDLKKIHETSLEHAENIKNVYIKDMEIFNKLYQEVADRHHFSPFSLNYLKNEFSAFSSDNQISIFFGK